MHNIQYIFCTLTSCELSLHIHLEMKNESCYFEWLQLQRNVTGIPHRGVQWLLQQVTPVV